MSQDSILSKNEFLSKFIENQDFSFYYSKPVVKHIKEFVVASLVKGFSSKATDIAEFSANHRTTLGHFLSEGVWEERYTQKIVKKASLGFTIKQAKETREPFFVIHDDTGCAKTKPSLQAKSPIERTEYHHSHLLGKQILGHQLQATMLKQGEHSLIYDLHRYDKQKQSKIADVCDIARSMPVPPVPAYALFDSWYTCTKVIDAYASKGYHCIGGLKTNRIIYPQGLKISITDFARHIEKRDVRLVTVNNSNYWVYRYEGALNDIPNAVVILSWPEKCFKKNGTLRAFLCTDVSLHTQTILQYYSKRWPIEIFFRQAKNKLGLDKYQIRAIKGIDRLWSLQALVYLFCTVGLGKVMSFSQGRKLALNNTKKQYISWIYSQAQNNAPIDTVIKAFKVA